MALGTRYLCLAWSALLLYLSIHQLRLYSSPSQDEEVAMQLLCSCYAGAY